MIFGILIFLVYFNDVFFKLDRWLHKDIVVIEGSMFINAQKV
jgi:hypothetical protein